MMRGRRGSVLEGLGFCMTWSAFPFLDIAIFKIAILLILPDCEKRGSSSSGCLRVGRPDS